MFTASLEFFMIAGVPLDALGNWICFGAFLLLAVGVGLQLFFEWVRTKIFGPRKTLNDIRGAVKLQEISEVTEGLCRVKGKVKSGDGNMVSPLGRKPCVYYQLEISKGLLGKVYDYENRTYSWQTQWSRDALMSDTQHQSFLIMDSSGQIEIDLGSTGNIGKSSFHRTQTKHLREFHSKVTEGSEAWPRLKSLYKKHTGTLVRAGAWFEKLVMKKVVRRMDKIESQINEVDYPDEHKDTFRCHERTLEPGDLIEVFGYAKRKKGKLVLRRGKWPLIVKRLTEPRPIEQPRPTKKSDGDCPKCEDGYIRTWADQQRCWKCGHIVEGKVEPKVKEKTPKVKDTEALAKRRLSRALKIPFIRNLIIFDLLYTLWPIISLFLAGVMASVKIIIIICLVLLVGCVAGLYHLFGPEDSNGPSKEPVTLPLKEQRGFGGKDANATSSWLPGQGD
tara:strand:+ start:144 stop:1484 length:1341 start_codon:yes stop_codon:yes gene_type:complete